jgi:PAS domain S-box-containing protein
MAGGRVRADELERAVATRTAELRRATAALRQSESQLRAIHNNTIVGLCSVDVTGRFTYANQGLLDMLGLTLDELLERRTDDVTHPEDLEESRRAIEGLLTGTQLHESLTKRYLRADGTYFWADVSMSVVRGAEGRVEAFVGVVQDATRRIRMQSELAESEQRFRTLAEQVPVSVWLTDSQGQVVYRNQSAAELMGEDVVFLPMDRMAGVHPADRQKVLDVWQAGRAAGAAIEIEVRYRPPDGGDYRWLMLRATPRYDPDGELLGYIGCATDLTEVKEAEEERRKLDARVQHIQKLESLSSLAGGVAHDFNNILMGVLGNAELMMMELPDHSPLREYLEDIESSATRAADLAHKMLAFSGHASFMLKEIDLTEAVAAAMPIARAGAPPGVELEESLDEDLPPIHGDESGLLQLVAALVQNAVEASQETQGRVTVKTETVDLDRGFLDECYRVEYELEPGTYTSLEVADTGHGMTDETRERMFEPFFSTRFAGRGLGLAASLGIIRAHRAAVRVRSAPGEGTRVQVLFPLSPPDLSEAIEELPAQVTQRLAGKVVMVVDDEAAVRDVTARVLRNAGCRVIVCSDGDEALRALEEWGGRVDLLVLDLTMPRVPGEQVFSRVSRDMPELPVIVASGYSEAEALARLQGNAPKEFLHKPFRPSALLAAAGRVLGGDEASTP